MKNTILFLLICPAFAFGQGRGTTETTYDTTQGIDLRRSQSSAMSFEERLYVGPTPQGYTLAIPCYPETPAQNPLQAQVDSLKSHVAALQKVVEAMQKAMLTSNSAGTTISDYPIGEPIRSWIAPRNGAQVKTGCGHVSTIVTSAMCPPGVKCNRATCTQCGQSWETY